MKTELNETHDPRARSFVESANTSGCDFPIQNLPFGAFTNGQKSSPRLCVAIGDKVLDLGEAAGRGLLGGVDDVTCEACKEPYLNSLMGLGSARWTALRRALFRLLGENSVTRAEAELCLCSQRNVTMVVPVQIGDYTDFYASVHHASNVGSLFRPENPLFPNYKWLPIGYHGRTSSIVVSGTKVRRPCGQLMPSSAGQPQFAPSNRIDYEVEVGALVGVGNELGEAIPIAEADDHIFGLCLLNDWSARDIQFWEYQPLGPFLAKSFGTTVSPWIVTAEALAPFRVSSCHRPAGDPEPLPYLTAPNDAESGGFDMTVEAYLRTSAMREANCPPHRVSRSRLCDMYWTFAQILAHQTSNGCNLRPGDLLASGTLSGPGEDEHGCLLEITRGGARPLLLPDGTQRTFLEDGDEVTLRAFCERSGAVRIGFGECSGTVIAAARQH
ncbi:MAG: fumarylacetoacetase [Acidobacteria bacterium]|nr:MAG: fumarylacetoacetase [Acidobacteriota bacterium]